METLPFADFNGFRGFPEDTVFGSGAAAPVMVLGGEEREEVMRVPAMGMGRRGGVTVERAAMVLRSHSEAERRRRERINAHLTTLRGLIPTADKLDKAALLGEVIGQVKELKRNGREISKGCNIPSDVDEVRVEADEDGLGEGRFLVKASLCCEDRPELLVDLKQTLQTLGLRTVRAEISILGGRVKNIFVLTCEKISNEIERHIFTNSVHQALKSVLERVSSPPDFLPRSSLSGKRQRVSSFESSSSSS